jgi:hypothetical protein
MIEIFVLRRTASLTASATFSVTSLAYRSGFLFLHLDGFFWL